MPHTMPHTMPHSMPYSKGDPCEGKRTLEYATYLEAIQIIPRAMFKCFGVSPFPRCGVMNYSGCSRFHLADAITSLNERLRHPVGQKALGGQQVS